MDTVVIGAGHAGLAASQQLQQRGVEHVVLERGRIAGSWRSMRWDSFALNTPSWMNRMPGEADASVPQPADGFLTRGQIVERLSTYADRWDLPVREGIGVSRMEPIADRGTYRIHLDDAADAPIDCRSVVVASGAQNVPRLPPIASALPASILQLAALDYKRPEQLPPGTILVVGAGQTGGQVVEELLAAGREVYWSVSAVTRVPRRYRGRDILEWLAGAGFYEAPRESITDPAELRATMPIISGVGRFGHTLSLQWLSDRGAQLIGRITSVDGDVLSLDDSVASCIRFADQRSRDVCAQIDEGILAKIGSLPPLEPDDADRPFETFDQLRPRERLDLGKAGVKVVVWATGVTGDFRYLPDDATSDVGLPEHQSGASPLDGIDYIGLPWLTRRGSGIINGIVHDAEMVAARVAARTRASTKRA